MSSSHTSTYPLSRQTPRKFHSRRKTVTDWAPSIVEGCGDNCHPSSSKVQKVNKDSDKFRYHTLPNFEILHKIFHGQVATGKYFQSSMVLPFGEDNEVTLQSGIQVVGKEQSGHNRMSGDIHQGNIARIPLPATNRKKQQTISAGISVASTVRSWEESTSSKGQSRRLRNSLTTGVGRHCHHPPPASSDHEACMQVLQAISGVDATAFAIACVSFRDVNHKRVFASIREDQRRLDWIYNHQIVSTHTPPPPPIYSHRPVAPYMSSYPPPYVSPHPRFNGRGNQSEVRPYGG